MKDIGPEHYRALHLDRMPTAERRRRGVNPSSPIAVLLASLVVSAHTDGAQGERGDPLARGSTGAPRAPDDAIRPVPATSTGDTRERATERGTGLATIDTLRRRWRSAVANDDIGAMRALLEAQPDIGLVSLAAPNGKTALMVAAKSDEAPFVEMLLQQGADLEARTATGGSAIMFAALGSTLDVVAVLHERGASLEAIGSNGWSALTIAAARGFDAMVDWLLRAGAEPAPVDVYGFTPLMRAVENGHDAVVRRLLEHGRSRIDHADEAGNTALHHAVANGRPVAVVALIEAGASLEVRNVAGYTARDLLDREELGIDAPEVVRRLLR